MAKLLCVPIHLILDATSKHELNILKVTLTILFLN